MCCCCGVDFAKELQNLARHGDVALMEIFEASFDGLVFNQETFDTKFFLENATSVVMEKKQKSE
jgi:hypothetical protein